MKHSFFNFLKHLLTSRIGLILFIAHIIVLVYRFSPRSNAVAQVPCELEFRFAGGVYIAGDYFHFTYENWLIQIVLLLDFPALIVSELLLSLFSAFNFCDSTKSWILGFMLLFLGSLQWLLIGFAFDSLIRLIKNK